MQTILPIDAVKAHKVKLTSKAPISTTSILILEMIKDGPVNLQELARNLKVKPPAMTTNASMLEKMGYAQRLKGTVNPTTGKPDGRMCELKITRKGKGLLGRIKI